MNPGIMAGTQLNCKLPNMKLVRMNLVRETIGFNDGAPSLFQIPIFREIAEKAILKVNKEYERERWGKEFHISFRDYRRRDRKAVVELWKTCQLIQPWEEPAEDINRRIKVYPDLFLVGIDKIVGTVMGRCDENRGWVEYLAVNPLFRGDCCKMK